MSDALTASIGWGAKGEAAQVGAEAAEMALSALRRSPHLAIVFGSSWFDQAQLLEGVRAVLGETPMIGGSTAGEILPDGPVTHSCVVLLLSAEGCGWSVGVGEEIDRVPRAAGQQAALAATRNFHGSPRAAFLLIGDGLVTNFADVTRGMQEVLGTSFLIAGGMAADDLRFDRTYQYANYRALTRSVVGVLLGGIGRMGVGIEHGFSPISRPRQITRAHANVLLELDHQPAASVYEEYFGADLVSRMREGGFTREGIAYPLGIRSERENSADSEAGQWLLRNVVAFRDDGGLSCSGEVREASWLQLMVGSRQLALEAAERAARQAIQSLNCVACVLVFDSIARRRLLGHRDAAMEIARIRQAIGPSVPLAGCYTYGEQGPLGTSSVYGGTVPQTGSVLVVALGT